MSNIKINKFESYEQACLACAKFVAELANNHLLINDLFSLCLGGGSTPKYLFKLLAAEPFSTEICWPQVHVCWGDDRCVPQDNPDSNFKMAKELLLDKISIPRQNILRIEGELNPSSAAQKYEERLKKLLLSKGKETPLSCVLLGIGEDGHTASLFPNSTALTERKNWVATVPAPAKAKPSVPRVTMCYPIINSADQIIFLAGGPKKQQIIDSILNDPDCDLPAALVKATEGKINWFIY